MPNISKHPITYILRILLSLTASTLLCLLFCIRPACADVPTITQKSFVPFDCNNPYSYCSQPVCTYNPLVNNIRFQMIFTDIPHSDDPFIYLFELSTYEDKANLSDKAPIAMSYKSSTTTFSFPYKTRLLFSEYIPAIKYMGEFYPLSKGQCITNPEALSSNNSPYPDIDSKKGLLIDANTIDTDWLSSLNVRRAAYNIPLSYIIGESDNPECPTIDYEYNGTIYHFDGYMLAGFDSLFSYLTNNGYQITAIILNDWNKDNPELIHPLSRGKTYRSMYYAFNTSEEDGVRLMEATALFLANRYNGGDYGMVTDWVIANEINQQKVWNYMATDNLDYYTKSFEQSFRTFYNAIKSGFSNAKVYYSIDHDWNNNGGQDYKYFNGRDLLYDFNEVAKEHGNYDWGLSIHPYPQPLTRTRFWPGSFDKSEYARIITPMNLSSLTSVMTKDDFLTEDGNVRDISITELGFSSRSGQKLQAAAFAYCYYIIEDNEYINSFLLNRQTDDIAALRSGLSLGIYNNDYSSKYIADVFANIDSVQGADYIPEMLEIIGSASLEEALANAR